MSPKSKLGRNPFEKAAAAKPAREAPGHAGAARATPKRRKKKPSLEAKVRKASSSKRKERVPEDLDALWHELTHYWMPRLKACAYMRVLKLVTRLSALAE